MEINKLRAGVLLSAILCLAVAGCGIGKQKNTFSRESMPYSFEKAPFVSPKIIQDLSSWESDSGDQTVSVNLTQSQDSNKYSGDINTKNAAAGPPYVFIISKDSDGETGEFGYQYVGRTSANIIILRTSSASGGSGVFENLILLTVREDRGIRADWVNKTIMSGSQRVILDKRGEIPLGDRWDGELKVEGDSLFIGRAAGIEAGNLDAVDGRLLNRDYKMEIKL